MNRSILLVDDDYSIIQSISSILGDVYDIKIAYDGVKGLELYKKFSPKILIVDINMPKLNGIEMIKKIRENDIQTKIIILTSHSDSNFLLDSIELKLIKYLIKPIEPLNLINAINTAEKELLQYDFKEKVIINLTQNCFWDSENMDLVFNNKNIKLTKLEKNILSFLISRQNLVISHYDIIDNVWEDNDFVSIDALKTMINKIRKKLPKDLIQNVYGIGYKLNISI